MVYLAAHGYRCLAHDRRGHGRSGQPWDGNEMDTYADDVATLVEALDLKDVFLFVGHSTGGGGGRSLALAATVRSRHLAKAVLIGAVPPLMIRTETNPGGLPMEAFAKIRGCGARRPLAVLQGSERPLLRRQPAGIQGLARHARLVHGSRGCWLKAFNAIFECIKAFSETDFTEDLRRFDVPTLILHGDDDQIVPIGASALLSSRMVKDARLKVYKGAPHGLCSTRKDEVNADLLEFFRA